MTRAQPPGRRAAPAHCGITICQCRGGSAAPGSHGGIRGGSGDGSDSYAWAQALGSSSSLEDVAPPQGAGIDSAGHESKSPGPASGCTSQEYEVDLASCRCDVHGTDISFVRLKRKGVKLRFHSSEPKKYILLPQDGFEVKPKTIRAAIMVVVIL